MPVFNGEPFVGEALRGILAQTYEDFELLVADNASTDRTSEIVRDFAARDPRIRYVRHPQNIGAIANFNYLFPASRGEYFRWAGADDVSLPTYVQRCMDILDDDPGVVLAYSDTNFIDDRGKVTLEFEDSLRADLSTPPARFRQVFFTLGRCHAIWGLMRRKAVTRNGLFGNFLSHDNVFLTGLALYGRFVRIPERLLLRRFHDAAMSNIAPPARIAHLDPKGSTPSELMGWKRYWEHWKVAARAPLPLSDKVRLAAFVARIMIMDRDRLFRDVIKGDVLQDAGVRHQ